MDRAPRSAFGSTSTAGSSPPSTWPSDLGHGYSFGRSTQPFGNETNSAATRAVQTLPYPLRQRHPRNRGFRPPRPFDRPETGRKAWWIIRGTDNLPLIVGGIRLPDTARLRLHRLESIQTKPLDEFALLRRPKGAGLLYQVTMAAQGQPPDRRRAKTSATWEGLHPRIHQRLNQAGIPFLRPRGLLPRFGLFPSGPGVSTGPVAGLTHIDKKASAFSAYRFHDTDPVFFQTGLKLTLSHGEETQRQENCTIPPTRALPRTRGSISGECGDLDAFNVTQEEKSKRCEQNHDCGITAGHR